MVQFSHPYMTTGKTIALTRRTFVGKVMSPLFNMLSGLVIAFLTRSRCLLISRLQSPSAVILESPQNSLFPLFPHLFAMKWWAQMPWMLYNCSIASPPLRVQVPEGYIFVHYCLWVQVASGAKYHLKRFRLPPQSWPAGGIIGSYETAMKSQANGTSPSFWNEMEKFLVFISQFGIYELCDTGKWPNLWPSVSSSI